ncbi:MAG: hypothetical protein WCH39_07725, partial [Schlesneria sp.]
EVAIWKIVKARVRCEEVNFECCATASDFCQSSLLAPPERQPNCHLRSDPSELSNAIRGPLQFGFDLAGASDIGLRRSLAGDFGDASDFSFFEAIKLHWMTEDGHPVAPESFKLRQSIKRGVR